MRFKDPGVYLITGGLGHLGILFANEILEQTQQARVVLTGRSPLSAEKQAVLERLSAHAGRVSYRDVDLGDLDQVTRLIAAIENEHGQLTGILHSAGMIADNFILKKSAAEFREVLLPKVVGTINLDRASADAELDFFVLFSSTAGAFGNPGQADYASANGFMDQFAAYRNRQVAAKQRHGRTRSINWWLWRAGGMSADPASLELARQTTGVQPMHTRTGVAAFHRILALPCDQMLAAQGDLARMRRAWLAGAASPSATHADRPAVGREIDQENLAEKTQAYLCRQLAALLTLPPRDIDPNAALEKYGVDSILAMRLTNRFEETFGPLSKTLFFEYQTIRDLTQYFVAQHSTHLAALFARPGGRPSEETPVTALAPIHSGQTSTRRGRRIESVPGSATRPAATEPDSIAIIGLSGRYPEAADLEAYWRNLREGKDCIVEVPKERWDWHEYFSDDRTMSGRHYSKWGGFIAGVDEFDPIFFNISPAEAELTDPQERLFLQHAWMAIEDAGYTRASLQVPCGQDLAGQVGVYAGVWTSEYQLFGAEASLQGKRLGFAVSLASIANRVSYALNLHGPSITLDTMCSASLTAIHLACQDLKQGRTSLAIAGGVNVSIHPNKYLMLSAAQAVSTDGHCRSFGEGGDGYVPAEGVGVVVLKRLSEATKDGDHIYGIIRGSALNHGGKTNGFTVPNPQAQASAISRALAESHTDARLVSYIEAHGTGTKLGDPIEIAALTKAFRQYTQDAEFCAIGSVKSNIGHCESAAGVAGLTKVLLQMQHRELVPSLHSRQLNTHVDFHDSPFVVTQSLRPWDQPVIGGRTVPRIAGISSFGASGANAHMIVEEYQEPTQHPAAPATVVIPLSARTATQLQQKVADLLGFVRARQSTIDLVATAYTLQVGREAMDERFGVVVSSVEQLIAKLQACVSGEQDIEDAYRGQVKRNRETLSVFGTDPDLQQTVDKWIANKKFSRLLDLWGKGLEVDWSKLYGETTPRRISLPVYPFARDRYWINIVAAAPAGAGGAAAAVLHPLLHSNTSDLRAQRYSSMFSGEEFFLADHQVKADGRAAQKVLPAVAYLEMARAAIERALPAPPEGGDLELHNTVWMRPVVMTGKKEITIELAANDDDQIDYEIYSQDGDEKIVHCQGRAGRSRQPAPAALDLGQLEAQMGQGRVEPNRVYAAYARMGLVYGPSFQPIAAIQQGTNQLLAQLRLPRSVEDKSRDYVLHPSVMDGALQAGVWLAEGSSEDSRQPSLPFALESLRIAAPCTSEMTAWVRYAPGSQAGDPVVKMDIDLCDQQGRVCVRMQGLAGRALEGAVGESRRSEEVGADAFRERGADPPMRLVTLAPVWEPVKVEAGEVRPRAGERVVVIGGDDEQHRALRQACGGAEVPDINGRATVEEIAEKLRGGRRIDHLVWILPGAKQRAGECEAFIEDQEEGVLLGFRLIKALLREGYGAGELAWTVITTSTQRIGGNREQQVDAAHSSVHGLVGSMAKEYAKWKVRLVDVGSGVWPWGAMLRLGWDARGEGWGYREGQWYRRRLVECELNGTESRRSGYKLRGVYVVIGGAGGVGEVLTDYLIRKYDARVVWIGRREKDAAIEKKQDRVTAGGGDRPFYITADARKREDLERACTQIKERYGRIDGVIHSTIVLADKTLANMAEEQFRAGLSAKLDVAVRLAQVFGREPLDFVLYFSSVQSFMTAPGQSNYAAACTFMDAFAQWQSLNVVYPVKVMNWGYWGSVGLVASGGYQERLEQEGLGSLEPQEGMAGLERLLRSPLEQVGMVRMDPVKLARALDVTTGVRMWAAPQEAPAVCGRVAERVSAVVGQEPARELIGSLEEQRRGFDEVLVKMLWGQMQGIGWKGEEERWSGIPPQYERWMNESLLILARHGYVADQGRAKAEGEQLWSEWEREKSRWLAADKRTAAQVKLVETMLRSLPEILRGEKRATDVMFPNSSLELVEELYKNSAVMDHFNRVMTEVVGCYVEERRRAEGKRKAGGMKLRLLELGAGTGAGSQGILRKLDEYRDEVEEYCYSDISKWFVQHGEQVHGRGRTYLKYAVVDVEKALEQQGVETGVYDVVLAANVLHATRRIREAVRNAKAALKANGVLVLNELGAKSVYTHLTFGLLDGWWLYEDEELRMEGNPGLTAEIWTRVLGEEGFRTICFPAQEAYGLGQQIIVAESDGIIRQEHAATKKPQRAVSDVVPSPATATIAPSRTEETRRSGLPEKVAAWLVEAVGLLLKVKREDIDVDAELSEFGFDSISLTGFANHVNHAFALELMPTIFYEHPTLRSFTEYLVQNHAERLAERIGPERGVGSTAGAATGSEAASTRREGTGSDGRRRGRAPVPAKGAILAATEPKAQGSRAQAIAIIGMSGRFPGAEDLDAFWENLKAGRDSIREIPPERWDWRALCGDESEDGNKGSVKWGAFIEGVDEFDPLFFGISPLEAETMDPQQRLLMMYGWKAFEDAGYGPQQLWGSRTGIFIGTASTGFSELLVTQANAGIEGYSAAGLVPSVGPNRLSYFLNLHGPSEPIETACSSSLVAIHRAVRAIIGGECEMALVGGVNTLLSPSAHVSFSKAGMLSRDGKCKTFSSRADGYVRGEGVGMIVLKRLGDAERDGDQIYGTIRGSAENHGGRAQSLTAPNPQAQAEVIKDAYRRAGVSPRSVSYIEAHGTGTALGDPVEINGLKSAFHSLYVESGEQPDTGYCGLGSVKSNIGHLELAAGIAGLIKVLLQLKHRMLVPSLHCEEVNPYIRLEESPFYIVREAQPWRNSRDGEPLRAGVSSFGFGGVNAHVVVEEYLGGAAVDAVDNEAHGPVMVVVSARDEQRLKEQAGQLRQAIERRHLTDADLAALAYTLQVGREPMEHRLGMTVGSMQELAAKLEAFVDGKGGIEGLYRGEVKRNSDSLAAFGDDEELRDAVGKWIERGRWSRLLELWVKGFPIEWERTYGKAKPRKLSLPTYPFAKEHYWIDTAAGRHVAGAEARTRAALAVLHPLVHRNTSDLNGQRYTSTFTGEEFFLADHRVRMDGRGLQAVLPAAAYLEMARAAIAQASPDESQSSVIELHDTMWLRPVAVTGPTDVSIALSVNDDEQVDFEIYSGEGAGETIHCQGHAVFSRESAPVRLDLERLRGEMRGRTLDAADLYAIFDRMGLSYGPAQRGITEIHLGENQVLARLHLPAVVEGSEHEYVLHPSVMDSALQASIGLLVDRTRIPSKPSLPFVLESVRILSACAKEMVAWLRYSERSGPEDKSIKLDIDLCDHRGNVCIQMRGFALRAVEGGIESVPETATHDAGREAAATRRRDSDSDDDFYQKLIADVVNGEVSVDEAVGLG